MHFWHTNYPITAAILASTLNFFRNYFADATRMGVLAMRQQQFAHPASMPKTLEEKTCNAVFI
jgi:hypothetical protein